MLILSFFKHGQSATISAGSNGSVAVRTAPQPTPQPMAEPIHQSTTFSQKIHDIFAKFSRRKGTLGTGEQDLIERYKAAFADEERLKEQIRSTIPTKRLNDALFDSWADGYDQHMGDKHDPAVAHLVRQALELHNKRFGTYAGKGETREQGIFGKEILEMSCGTGTVIKLLCENLRCEDRKDLTFIANDTSKEMKAKAKEKLATMNPEHKPCKVRFASSDLRELDVKGDFNTAILSQTLHLLSDPVLLDKERQPQQTLFEIDEEHLAVKLKVIKDVFGRMDFGDHFILIDEWPAVLTRRGQQKPEEALISALFYEIFRPIKERATFSDMMKNIPSACFVAELRSRIDQHHSMYMLIYRRTPYGRISAVVPSPRSQRWKPARSC